jgi:plastocyanin
VRGGISPQVRRALLTAAALGALAVAPSVPSALAGDPNNIDADDNFFSLSNYVVMEGQQAGFSNIGDSTHNATANENGPDGGPLFRTGNVAGGQSGATRGSQFLSIGSYDFVCTIHPSEMQATLNVVDNPSRGPLARPKISLKVKSKKLEKVVDSGKLKVKVTAREPTDADGVSLIAKAAKRITKKKTLNVNAGDSKTAKLKLKKSALAKLADLEKAKVKVTGDVDFGFGDKASKKLK